MLIFVYIYFFLFVIVVGFWIGSWFFFVVVLYRDEILGVLVE